MQDDVAAPPPTEPRPRRPRRAYREPLMAALLSGANLDEAARAAGISRRTAQRWTSANRAELERAEEALVAAALRELRTGLVGAAKALKTEVENKDGPATIRITAARTLFAGHRDLAELQNFDERLRRIEDALTTPAQPTQPHDVLVPRLRTILGGNNQ